MKILILIDSLVSGGRERRLIELIKGFQGQNDVELMLVVFSDKIHYQEVFELDVTVKILKRVPKKNPMVFFRLFKLCRSFKPDLIHSWGTMSTIFAIPSSLLLKIKLINGNIVDAPNHLNLFDKRLFRAKLTFPFSDVIVGNSLAGLKAYSVPKNKGICIYNGFDLNRVSNLKIKTVIREQFKVSTEKVVGMVGSFSDRKDFETFIEAALIVLKQRNDVSFIAVGDGPKFDQCKKMIPTKYAPFFIFTGEQRDVESIINIFDIGVLSTNTKVHGEGISNAILEYMALEKPTVATTGGGTNEAVDESTGFLIPANSPKVMADTLNNLLQDPDLIRTMGVASRHRLQHIFGLDKMTTSFYQLYKKLIDE